MTRRAAVRAGFGLIELLVSISIILALAGFAFLMYPGVRDQDRVRNAVTDVGSTCKLAQAMAARDKAPRGVRFITGTNALDPMKTDPRWVTELQYVELPPPLIPNLNPLTPSLANPTAHPNLESRVRFAYTPAATTSTNPLPGTITGRRCFLENLTAEQAAQVQAGCTIVMPNFGTWHRISAIPAAATAVPASRSTPTIPAIPLFDLEVQLEVFPDAILGAGTSAVIYHFAIYLLATPLVGEPTVLLPKGICVDLNPSDPITTPAPRYPVGSIGPSGAGDFDVIFAPDGKLVGSPNGQLFLLVRDYTKGGATNIRVVEGLPLVDAFRRAGEMHYLTIRASGSLGHAPVTWPDAAGNYNYPAGQTPFTLARQELNQ